MKSAGIAVIDGRMIVTVLINSTVQIHRVKNVNEAKEILDTAKPDIVGMDESTAEIYEDVKFQFNTVKVRRLQKNEMDSLCNSLTMLNIIKDQDKPAIVAASLALTEKSSD
jgi:hypothetical protein